MNISNIDVNRLNPLLKSWGKIDYAIFFLLVPAVLTFVYILPFGIKDYLVLQPLNPTFLSIFFSNYTHIEFFHFFNNILAYLIIIFLIFNIETDKKLFYKTSLLIFILLPFISSLSIIYLTPTVSPTLGFSAISSAFLGYLLYAVYNFLKNAWKLSLNNSFLFFYFVGSFTLCSKHKINKFKNSIVN